MTNHGTAPFEILCARLKTFTMRFGRKDVLSESVPGEQKASVTATKDRVYFFLVLPVARFSDVRARVEQIDLSRFSLNQRACMTC